jgi:16S rRNA (cytosine1402-N4)-methyltransferase
MLNIRDEGIYVDATFGGGGHSLAILNSNPAARLIAFDQDKDAIEKNSSLFSGYSERFILIKDNFANLRTHLALRKIKQIDGIIFDLGISNYQIRTGERGFSFGADGSLDMRMNRESDTTAYEVVNYYSLEELHRIFRDYGEEKESLRVAKRIIKARSISPITSTDELASIVERSVSSPMKIKAKARVFQALRIYVNRELEVLEDGLSSAVEVLAPLGRLVVISYHSLEDRIVKQLMNYEAKDCECPPKFPMCVCDKEARLKIISKKPIVASVNECSENKQARSAKMRVAEKL